MLSSNCSEKASVCGTESNKASLTCSNFCISYIRTYKKYPNHKHELLKLPLAFTSVRKDFPCYRVLQILPTVISRISTPSDGMICLFGTTSYRTSS